MAIYWPATLPPALQDGYGETPPETVIRWRPDFGPSLVRRAGSANVSEVSFKYEMTQSEAIIFDTFYNITTKGGSLPFVFVHPRTGIPRNTRFVSVSYGSQDQYVIVNIKLELLP